MSKGDETRSAILSKALSIASLSGLEDLNFGGLAKAVGMSKSGLFAHFGSKEALQLAILDTAAERFVALVIMPALEAPRGLPRIRALFENWMSWETAKFLPGGCPFVAIAAEVDDKPGPVRDRLVSTQRDWLEFLAGASQAAIRQGDFAAGVDPEQFAYDAHSIVLGFHYFSRLLRDPRAFELARAAFEALIARNLAPKHAK